MSSYLEDSNITSSDITSFISDYNIFHMLLHLIYSFMLELEGRSLLAAQRSISAHRTSFSMSLLSFLNFAQLLKNRLHHSIQSHYSHIRFLVIIQRNSCRASASLSISATPLEDVAHNVDVRNF